MRILDEGLALEEDAAVNALALINNYVFGFAYRERAWDQLRRRAQLTDEQWRERLNHYLVDAKRQNSSLARALEARLRSVGEDSFDFGLDCVLAGIEAHFELARGRSRGSKKTR